MDVEAYVAALRHEREGYVRMGQSARVAEVDAEIARWVPGVETASVSADAVETSDVRRRRGR